MLLEMAIVISIVGLISGFFVTRTRMANKIMKARITKENIEIVTESLAAYVATHCRLPRPTGDDGSGLERPDSSDLQNYVGKVPFKTLGIPEKQTLDGNAHPLQYIVEQYLTKPFEIMYNENPSEDIRGSFCGKTETPKIEIDARIVNDKKDIVAFVIDATDKLPSISSGTIYVKVSTNTKWMTRALFLARYFKGSLHYRKEPQKSPGISNHGDLLRMNSDSDASDQCDAGSIYSF
ncbi:hypothetical protein FACS1894122_02930 [Alphaproteobacteria bacterium]|nr:hypothetical protein FACS1894122_02930 [Alphaproteobacteria bacterium]